MFTLGGILLGFFVVVCVFMLVLYSKCVIAFRTQRCPDCNTFMEYTGVTEDSEDKKTTIYMFYCPECKTVHEIPEDEIAGCI